MLIHRVNTLGQVSLIYEIEVSLPAPRIAGNSFPDIIMTQLFCNLVGYVWGLIIATFKQGGFVR
jgi:hypothetical protein